LRPHKPLFWNQTTIDRLNELDNKCTLEINFWFSQVKEGYIYEFFVEYNDYFNEAERHLSEGPRKIIL
jgi:hypothetical protein